MTSLWMKKEVFKEEGIMVLDCGYVNDENIKSGKLDERMAKLKELGIGKKNVRLELNNRLMVNIPKSKQKKVLEQIETVEPSYYGTTHKWKD